MVLGRVFLVTKKVNNREREIMMHISITNSVNGNSRLLKMYPASKPLSAAESKRDPPN